MDCPKCRTPTVERLPVEEVDDRPWRCTRCRGLWVEPRQLAKLISSGAADKLDRGSRPAPESETGLREIDRQGGLCPRRHGILGRARIEGNTEEGAGESFYLDRCVTCGGMWFDAGEWRHLAEADLLADAAALWSRARKVPEPKRPEAPERDPRTFDAWSWLAQDLGEELHSRLVALGEELADHPAGRHAVAYLREQVRRGPEGRRLEPPSGGAGGG